MQIEPRALEMMAKKRKYGTMPWKMLQYWCYMMITYAIISAFVYLATYNKPQASQKPKAMSTHVEIKRGGQWLKYELLGQY